MFFIPLVIAAASFAEPSDTRPAFTGERIPDRLDVVHGLIVAMDKRIDALEAGIDERLRLLWLAVAGSFGLTLACLGAMVLRHWADGRQRQSPWRPL